MGGIYKTQEEHFICELKNSLNERLSGFICESTTKLIKAKIKPERAHEIINSVVVNTLEEKKRSTLVLVGPPIEYDLA